jgi:hypothetical protein
MTISSQAVRQGMMLALSGALEVPHHQNPVVFNE